MVLMRVCALSSTVFILLNLIGDLVILPMHVIKSLIVLHFLFNRSLSQLISVMCRCCSEGGHDDLSDLFNMTDDSGLFSRLPDHPNFTVEGLDFQVRFGVSRGHPFMTSTRRG